MKIHRIILASLALASVASSSSGAFITSLAPDDANIESGEVFNLIVGLNSDMSDASLVSFEFDYLGPAFSLLGVTMLEDYADFSILPTVIGLANVESVFDGSSTIEVVSLQLQAVGLVGTHSVSVSGLFDLNNPAFSPGAFLLDSSGFPINENIQASVDLRIQGSSPSAVSDHGATGLTLFGATVLLAFFRSPFSKR